MAYDLTIEIDAKQTGLTMKGQFYDASGAVGSEITTGFTADTAGGYLWKGPSPSDTFTGKFVAYTGTYSLANRIGSIAIAPTNADFAQVDLKKVNGTNVTSSTDPVNANVTAMDAGVITSIVNAVVTGLSSSFSTLGTAVAGIPAATVTALSSSFTTVTNAISGVPAAVWAVSAKAITSVGNGAITWASYGNMMPNGTVLASPTPTTTTFRASGATLGATTDFHIGQAVIWQNGQNFGKAGIITAYSSSKDVTVAANDAWAFAPTAGDTFVIQGKVPKASA